MLFITGSRFKIELHLLVLEIIGVSTLDLCAWVCVLVMVELNKIQLYNYNDFDKY